MDSAQLIEQARSVLDTNDQGSYSVPAEGLYPHQWLWDSCFVAIGQRHFDVERAKTELLSLLRGQWANGMLPHMIFAEGEHHRRDRNIWRSWLNPNAPDSVATSGLTQPPMLAEAIVRVGERLSKTERRSWYLQMYPALLHYHQWLYATRDPHGEGLTVQIHPWETGFDNTPPWMRELHDHQLALWIRIADRLHIAPLLNYFRRDKFMPSDQRLSTVEALGLYDCQIRLRRKQYDIDKVLRHSLFAIEDVAFNCILIRANHHLRTIAKTIRKELPPELVESMHKTEQALEDLWDPFTEQYYPRNFVTHKLIKEPSLATLLPLYAGTVSHARAETLVKLLKNKHAFAAKFPVPSVPLSSPWFKAHGYWQGPTWINTNWLIIDGLRRYHFDDLASELRDTSIKLVATSGFYEYFSPLDGTPAGAENFSWTAALIIDLMG